MGQWKVSPMWGRKRSMAGIDAERREAQAALERADSQASEVQSRWPLVSSLASTVGERRQRNGLGETLQITFAQRN